MNQISATVKLGIYEFRVLVEFTSYMQGKAMFRVLEPRGLTNVRVKVEKLYEADLLMVIGETLRHLAQNYQTNYQKWTRDYRGVATVGKVEIQDDSCVVDEEKPEPRELCDIAIFYLNDFYLLETSTPPNPREFWKWYPERVRWDLVEFDHDIEGLADYYTREQEVRNWLQLEKNWTP
jgi:hypothetical protein